MLIELIFRGYYSDLNFEFLKNFISEAREIYFLDPELVPNKSFTEILNIINSHNYIDLVINTDRLVINEKIVPKVFINVGRDSEDIEVMFYFDLADLGLGENEGVEYLKIWADEVKKSFKFNDFTCKSEDAANNEYIFDSNKV